VTVGDEVYQTLEELRKRKGRLSVPEIVREAISEYLEREMETSKPILEG